MVCPQTDREALGLLHLRLVFVPITLIVPTDAVVLLLRVVSPVVLRTREAPETQVTRVAFSRDSSPAELSATYLVREIIPIIETSPHILDVERTHLIILVPVPHPLALPLALRRPLLLGSPEPKEDKVFSSNT